MHSCAQLWARLGHTGTHAYTAAYMYVARL